MNKRALKSYIRRDSTGQIDIDASAQAFSQDLQEWVLEQTDNDVYAEVVQRVFKENKKAKVIPIPTLIVFAMRYITCEPSNWKKHAKGLKTYIGNAIAQGKLASTRGRYGGISRVKKSKKGKKS